MTTEQFPVPDPENRPDAPTGPETEIKEPGLVMSGLKSAIASLRERRVASLEDKIESLEEDLEVRQTTAEFTLIPGRPVAERTPDQALEDRRTRFSHKSAHDLVDGDTVIVPSLRPRNRAEIRAAKKADKKLRRNMRQGVVNDYTIKSRTVTGVESDIVPGTVEFVEHADSGRYTKKESREMRKTSRRTESYARDISGRIDDVEKMAEGLDRKGLKIRKKIDKADAKIQKHLDKLGNTDDDSPETTQSIYEARPLEPMSDSIKTMFDPSRDVLTPATNSGKVYVDALKEIKRIITDPDFDSFTVDDIDEIVTRSGASNDTLKKFVITKLKNKGVIDSYGNITTTSIELDQELLQSQDPHASQKSTNTPELHPVQRNIDADILAASATIKHRSELLHQAGFQLSEKESADMVEEIILDTLGRDAKAVDISRLRDALLPAKQEYESKVEQKIADYLRVRGHLDSKKERDKTIAVIRSTTKE